MAVVGRVQAKQRKFVEQRREVWLTGRLDVPVGVRFTRNRSTMFSSRLRGGTLRVRLHEMFMEAPEVVWDALFAYLKWDDPSAGQVLDRFIEAASSQLSPGLVALQPLGRVHRLDDILNELNEQFFHGACAARITWGQGSARRRRCSSQLGSYVAADKLIRVHPCLDQSFVPRDYVGWVVFHEMLHELFGVEQRGKRRCIHPPEFQAVEQTYPNYLQWRTWEKAHLPRLLAYRG